MSATGEPRHDTLNDLAKDFRCHNPHSVIRKNYVNTHNVTAAHTNSSAHMTNEERAKREKARIEADDALRTNIEEMRQDVRASHNAKMREDLRVMSGVLNADIAK